MSSSSGSEDEGLISDYDERHPEWHTWLSVPAQKGLTVFMYLLFVVWCVLYLLLKVDVIKDPDGTVLPLIMCLLPINYLFAFILLVGMISVANPIAMFANVLLAIIFTLICVWPRLIFPICGGLLPFFGLHALIFVIWQEGVIEWGKFGVPGYMTMMGPIVGLINVLQFKGWCAGYWPMWVYCVSLPTVMILVTIKELVAGLKSGSNKDFDYNVPISVYKRLIAFRLAVLAAALGYAPLWLTQQMVAMLRDDVWECTPLLW